MACDIVVADEAAEFALPEARLGVLASYALTRGRLARGALAYLAFTARRVGAAEAARLGLADAVGEDPGALAREIAAHAPGAVQAAKRLLRGGGGLAAAADASVAALRSPEHAARVAAFRAQPRARGST
jgi:enoyl-CoA hydratase/carnithine racemase